MTNIISILERPKDLPAKQSDLRLENTRAKNSMPTRAIQGKDAAVFTRSPNSMPPNQERMAGYTKPLAPNDTDPTSKLLPSDTKNTEPRGDSGSDNDYQFHPSDILEIMNYFNNPTQYQVDMNRADVNRDGVLTPHDILAWVDRANAYNQGNNP